MNSEDVGITVGLIPARGGSKGIPRKNLRILNGIPLVAHAIRAARNSKLIDRVLVSSDDPEIIAISNDNGAETPFIRPSELSSDDSPEWLTWKHTLEFLQNSEPACNVKALACIPPTSPMRSPNDIDVCIQTLLDTDADIVITVTPSSRNPYFNMIEISNEGYVKLANPNYHTIYRRQDAPQVFDITTVAYAVRPEFIRSAESMFDGKIRSIEIPRERALDIDTELDLQFAEFLIQNNDIKGFNADE